MAEGGEDYHSSDSDSDVSLFDSDDNDTEDDDGEDPCKKLFVLRKVLNRNVMNIVSFIRHWLFESTREYSTLIP